MWEFTAARQRLPGMLTVALIFWVRGIISTEGQWASALSIPHTLTLDGDTLVAIPHADLETYSRPGSLEQVSAAVFETVLDDGADLRCAVTAGTVISLATLDGPLATVRHDGDGIRVTVAGNPDFADAFLPADEGSELRAFIDAGVLELSARQGSTAVPLPIVHAPVTLMVANTASTPLLNMISKLTVNGVGTHTSGRTIRTAVTTTSGPQRPHPDVRRRGIPDRHHHHVSRTCGIRRRVKPQRGLRPWPTRGEHRPTGAAGRGPKGRSHPAAPAVQLLPAATHLSRTSTATATLESRFG
jgi:hypothetical protein